MLVYTFLIDPLLAQHKNPYRKVCTFGCQSFFVFLQIQKALIRYINLYYFSAIAWELKTAILHIFIGPPATHKKVRKFGR
jgi:hypothetical protein